MISFYGNGLYSGPIFTALVPDKNLIVINGYILLKNGCAHWILHFCFHRRSQVVRPRSPSDLWILLGDGVDDSVSVGVQEVRSDSDETNWITFGSEGRGPITLISKGEGGRTELLDNLPDDKAIFALLRLVTGDQESKRAKFIFITWIGPSTGVMARAKAPTMKSEIVPIVGQFHIEVRAEDRKELSEDVLVAKLKVAGGADYDTGSNKSGYKSEGGSIKARAMANYSDREKEGNIGPIRYVTSALPKTTPVDLSGRPMVAPPSEAQKNTTDNVNAMDKWQS